MSTDASAVALAGILDALTLVQGQLDKVARWNERIEATQKEILTRLDTIDAGQAAVTDLVPILETILARSIEDRDIATAGFATIAEAVGFAHSAASGNPAPLPVDLLDDPLLERFALAQPPDRASERRAIVEWQSAARTAGTAELVDLLVRQYRPSPTDTAQTRVLRYQLASITRSELEARKVAIPAAPSTTRSQEQTQQARETRSRDLEQLWRAGESAALFADPELAGVLDLFAEAERRSGPIGEEQLVAELAVIHRELGDRLAAGERPAIEAQAVTSTAERGNDRQPEKDR